MKTKPKTTDLLASQVLLKKVTYYVLVLLFTTLLPENLSAFTREANLKGIYNSKERIFHGTIVYQLPLQKDGTVVFHLPPNRFSKPDHRSVFDIETGDNSHEFFERSELGALKAYRKKNLHTAISIKVTSVQINQELVEYKIVDNPSLSPLFSTENTLLIVNCKKSTKEFTGLLNISIDFITEFQQLPEDFVALLWDFAPRLAHDVSGNKDLADHWSNPFLYHFEIRHRKNNRRSTISEYKGSIFDTSPTFILPGNDNSFGTPELFLSDYLVSDKLFLEKRVQKIKTFLIKQGWLGESDFNVKLAMWDGPLTVTGGHILLPQHLFRYHSIYYKSFEVTLVKGFIQAALKKRYLINSRRYPWLIPALTSEVIRTYLSDAYDSNTLLFPWGQWLNPDFYQENSIKAWLSYPEDNELLAANDGFDLHLQANTFHPWFEKGFHLLWTITESSHEMRSKLVPNIQKMLTSQPTDYPILNSKSFSDFLQLTSKQKKAIKQWFAIDGIVDYEITDVNFIKNEKQVEVSVDVSNLGSLSPVFEISFTLENGLVIKEEITNGSGQYTFSYLSKPIEISINPKHKLLENNLLNNHWHTPFKVRPIWDFPSSNRWIVTVSPTINGNTFDRNLLGLSLGVSYLNKTELYISGWSGDGDEQLLWESSLFHNGYPWKGSVFSWESSELNASNSKALGYQHRYFDIHKDLWFSIKFLEETLDQLEEDASSDNNTWQSVESHLSFPIYIGDFSDSYIKLYSGYGRNTEDATNDFYQQGIVNESVGYLNHWKLHLKITADYSFGSVPIQKKYPLGGPEGLPGFPRETNLLYNQRGMTEVGITPPPYLTHTNLNILRLGWLERMETALFFHYGEGTSPEAEKPDVFRDVELRFNGTFSWLNMYEGEGVLSIAKPIGHDKYKDYRIILFSNWVF